MRRTVVVRFCLQFLMVSSKRACSCGPPALHWSGFYETDSAPTVTRPAGYCPGSSSQPDGAFRRWRLLCPCAG